MARLAALLSVLQVSAARADRIDLLAPIVGTTELVASDPGTGLGLAGYDPLGYRFAGRPQPGLPRYELTWGGVAWRFASDANRKAFAGDPHAFLPRIGGYDASAAAVGHVASANPLIFALQGDRLYLFRTEEGRTRFIANASAGAMAESGWERVKTHLVGR